MDMDESAVASSSAVDLRNAHLAPGVKIEPLVDRWYAWPHLLAPAQQALNLAYRYLPTVRSFLASPEVHAAAADDPTMFGGPFLGLQTSRVDAVAEYLKLTEARRADALAFARDFRDFDLSLQQASGFSLNNQREAVPNSLRGRVELVYDLNDHPKVRLLEEMFTDDDLGHAKAQSLRVHRQPDVLRDFFLSTPRLEDADLHLRTKFSSDATSQLYRARYSGVDLIELASALDIGVDSLAPWFAATPSPVGQRYRGPGVRVRYFGHASLFIETAQSSILVDPTFAQDPATSDDHFTLDDLPRAIDVLLISHGHQDHLTPEMLLHLAGRVGTVLVPPHNAGDISDPSLRLMLRSLGFSSVHTLHPLDTFQLSDGRITALPFSGEHCDLDVHSKQCALVELQDRRIGLFVDSDAIDIDVYGRLAGRLRALDLLFIGMECFGAPLSWLYGPLHSSRITRRDDESRRMSGANRSQAWRLVELLAPRSVCVYAMGQEPWMRSLMGLNYTEDSVQLKESGDFLNQCAEAAIPAERLSLKMERVL